MKESRLNSFRKTIFIRIRFMNNDDYYPCIIFQCVGRAIRGKTDYGIMVFADKVNFFTY